MNELDKLHRKQHGVKYLKYCIVCKTMMDVKREKGNNVDIFHFECPKCGHVSTEEYKWA